MTIYEIAEKAGVSASTVSRVINNKSGVNQEIRARVKLLLEQYHFAPDVAAKGLSEGSSRLIGIMLEDIRTLHDAESAYTIERVLSKAGYDSLIINAGSNIAEKKQAIISLAARRAEGAVMVGSTFQNSAVETVITQYLSNIPVIMVNGYLQLPNVYCFLSDDEGGVVDCVKHLVDRGRKKVAFVNYSSSPTNHLKEKGYIKGIKAYATGQEPLIVALTEVRLREASCRGTRELLQLNCGVDAIIYADDYIALAGLSEIQRLGRKVPEDISIIGINHSPYGDLCYPRMTSLDTKVKALSTLCANSLIDIIAGKPVPHKTMIFPEMAQGEST